MNEFTTGTSVDDILKNTAYGNIVIVTLTYYLTYYSLYQA